MRFFTFLFTLLFSSQFIQAQVVAPDFTLTDIDGQSHHLYEYLDQGKTVILDFYAVWCSPCQENAAGVEAVWEALGPDGTDEVMILGIEADDDSTDDEVAMYAVDWNCTNPQINETGEMPDWYGLQFYPTYMVVCPDRSYIEYSGTPSTIESELLSGIGACAAAGNFATDARIFDYNSSELLCSGSTTPNITLMNMGSDNLTSVDIKVSLNGNLESTTNWTGDLSTYEFEDVSLPSLDVVLGDNALSITLENPNGTSDQDQSNNSITSELSSSGTSYLTDSIKFELYFDNFPQETTWEILNSQGQTVYSGGDYVGFPNFSPPIDTFLELTPGDCYSFNIYDAVGDGICCAFADPGEGFWKILTTGGELIAEGGTFTDQESAFFGTELVTDIEKPVLASIDIYPNPAHTSIRIHNITEAYQWSIYGVDGQRLLSGASAGSDAQLIDISSIAQAGVYVVRVETEAKVFVERLVVE